MTDNAQNPLKHIAITIDGTAASGKGTLATKISERYRIKFLDTGTLYRTAVYACLKTGVDLNDTLEVARIAKNMDFDFRHIGNNKFATFLNGENIEAFIRTPEIDKGIPLTAPKPEVRASLLDRQISFVKEFQPQYGVILDGRDCGARIAPHADIKFFVTGDVNIRARRRHKQLQEKGVLIPFEKLLNDMINRDERDAPNTIQTKDAHLIDCSKLNAEEVFQTAINIIEETTKK